MLGDLLRELLGAGGAGQAAKPAMKKGKPMARKSGGSGGASRPMTPSQRDFPGRTNYGVPEDNMIDTQMGYIQPQQYDQLMNASQGEQGYLNPFQGGGSLYRRQQPSLQRGRMPMNMDAVPGNFTGGRTGYYQGSNPRLQGAFNPIEDETNRLRVR